MEAIELYLEDYDAQIPAEGQGFTTMERSLAILEILGLSDSEVIK